MRHTSRVPDGNCPLVLAVGLCTCGLLTSSLHRNVSSVRSYKSPSFSNSRQMPCVLLEKALTLETSDPLAVRPSNLDHRFSRKNSVGAQPGGTTDEGSRDAGRGDEASLKSWAFYQRWYDSVYMANKGNEGAGAHVACTFLQMPQSQYCVHSGFCAYRTLSLNNRGLV